MNGSNLNSSMADVVSYNDNRLRLHPGGGRLPTGSSLQGSHNRLIGSGQGDRRSWLFAFNWSLFPYPHVVWNETGEIAGQSPSKLHPM